MLVVEERIKSPYGVSGARCGVSIVRESLKSLAAASTRLPSRIIMFSNEADDVCDDGVREVR